MNQDFESGVRGPPRCCRSRHGIGVTGAAIDEVLSRFS